MIATLGSGRRDWRMMVRPHCWNVVALVRRNILPQRAAETILRR
jgi:hypothetical protein